MYAIYNSLQIKQKKNVFIYREREGGIKGEGEGRKKEWEERKREWKERRNRQEGDREGTMCATMLKSI